MKTRIKRRIAIGAAGLTIVGAGGGAYALADRSGDSGHAALLNDAANRLNVSPNRLRSALRGAFVDRLDADVKQGRLTRKQADRIKRGSRRGAEGPAGPMGPPPGGPMTDVLAAAAKYLDLSQAQVRDEVQSGKSLADVAKDRGKSLDGLKAAIKDALQSNLDQRVDDLVTHAGPPGGPGHLEGGPGRFHGGPPPGGPPPGF